MPRNSPSKPRPPEREYSHRTLVQKLGVKLGVKSGVKSGQKMLILGVDDGAFIHDIKPFNPEFAERKPAADLDIIFFGAAQKIVRANFRRDALVRPIMFV